MKTYYLRYESDGTTYNDSNLSYDILEKVTDELDMILQDFSISYNYISVNDNKVSVDGCYEVYEGDFPVDEELLGLDDTESHDYQFCFSL